MALAETATRKVTERMPKVFDAKSHAVMDYIATGAFFVMAAMFWERNKRAAIGAAACGGVVLATSMLTNYPGGVKKVISFQTHGRIDAGLAGLTASIPNFLAFTGEPEAKYFRGAALAESVITGLTDFDTADASGKVIEMRRGRSA
jgi:hypothetical protein